MLKSHREDIKRIRLSKRDSDLLTEAIMCDKICNSEGLCTHIWAGYLVAKAGVTRQELLSAEFEIEYDNFGKDRYLVLSG